MTVKPLPTNTEYLVQIAKQLNDAIAYFDRMASRYTVVVKKGRELGDDLKSKQAFQQAGRLAEQAGTRDSVDGLPPFDFYMPYLDQRRYEKASEIFESAVKHVKRAKEVGYMPDPSPQGQIDALEDLARAAVAFRDCLRELQGRLVEQLGQGPSQTSKQIGTQLRNQRIKEIANGMSQSDRTPARVLKRAEDDAEMQRILQQYKEQKLKLTRDIVKKQI